MLSFKIKYGCLVIVEDEIRVLKAGPRYKIIQRVFRTINCFSAKQDLSF